MIKSDEECIKETAPKSPFLTTKDGTSIYFDENWDVGIGGGIWSTGVSLSKYFLDHPHLLRYNLQRVLAMKLQSKNTNISNKDSSKIRAIELGSGNGLLSCSLAAVVGDVIETLVVTDLFDHLKLMKQTVMANSHIVTLQNNMDEVMISDDNKKMKCHVVEHSWGKFETKDTVLSEKFDFIFGSDVAYRDYLHELLISSLLHFSHEYTISIIGVTMSDTKPIFFKKLREAGFRYDRIPDHLMSEEFRGTTFGLFVIQKDRNKVTL